jgi:hypothetical protein
MPRGVAVGRAVAAASGGLAQPQVDPASADRQAVLAALDSLGRLVTRIFGRGAPAVRFLGDGVAARACHEHLETDLDPRGNLLTRGDDGRHRLEVSGARLPVLFALIATHPARRCRPCAPRYGREWRDRPGSRPVYVLRPLRTQSFVSGPNNPAGATNPAPPRR